MSITIERASPSDAEAILAYLKTVGSETENLTFGKEGLPFTAEEEANYIRSMEASTDDIMLIAKHSGHIVGDASLHRMPRRMRHRGDFSIAVVKEYWNQGVGGRLLSEIIRFAKNNAFEIIDLQVRSDNLSAIHLYEKFGFKKIGTHPCFFNINGERIPFDYMYLEVE